ncbi:MAG: excinuclease ABC subunit UvrA [Rikenellaceae bacterium]|nr:excinuclease ABC subunit UvrA [Rikenellaceae bacterium]
MSENVIKIRGARANNLKNVSLDIPRDEFIVISGISGSGKSSFAFDTVYAEGQRRFVESLSSFARQFLGRMSKPDVDEISGIPPAIAIEQKVNTTNSRSTVGTVTEIYDYLRLLYARVGKTISPISGNEVKRDNISDITKYIMAFPEGTLLNIISPLGLKEDEGLTERLMTLKNLGFTRLYSNGEVFRIENLLSGKSKPSETLYLLVDRVVVEKGDEAAGSIMDSLQVAMGVNMESANDKGVVLIATGKEGERPKEFSTLFEADGISFEEPTELFFSFNNPLGACPLCSGLGRNPGIDESLVIPDPTLTIYQEAVACWRGDTMNIFLKEFINNAYRYDFPIHKPYVELTKEQKTLLWKGDEFFTGIEKFFEIVDANSYKIQYRFMKSKYTGWSVCPECNGKRLRKEALYVKVGGKSIDELLEMSIEKLYDFFKKLSLDDYERAVATRILKEIESRLLCLLSVGLPYLTLNRASKTLSGGESQRINLVSSIGSSLVGSLYILDEPSIGLHPRDTEKLITVLKQLRDLGNTLIVVEHDEEIIRSADHLVDFGPLAGVHGGEVVYQGPAIQKQSIEECGASKTLAYLSGFEKIGIPQKRRIWNRFIEIKGAMENNLKNIDVKFPLRVFTVVTGVSGSGKSSLVRDILYPALNRKINLYGEKPGVYKEISGDISFIKGVEYVDQNPVGKSTRSNPVTYIKVYDEIRKLFSEQPYAKANGYGHSHFSFNIEGGRCPDCQGDGVIKIEMQFMADVQMVCESCGGKRFKPDILEVRYREKNINDVLNMSVEEAIHFFSAQKEPLAQKIAEKLKPLEAVGLSYVQLGQSSSTLSGGESQRVKLATFLGKESSADPILFIFDEPTTGLHFSDIKKLMDSFNALIEKGHTVLVVEHNMDVVKCADWIIDMGPDGGEKGGEVVFAGTPEDLIKVRNNYTAAALREKML